MSGLRLRYCEIDGHWQEVQLNGELSIGRSSKCDIRLKDERVSNRHATVSLTPEGSVQLTDVGSSNGTRLGEERLSANVPSPLAVGQTFSMGNATFKLVGEDEPVLSAASEEESKTILEPMGALPTNFAAPVSTPPSNSYSPVPKANEPHAASEPPSPVAAAVQSGSQSEVKPPASPKAPADPEQVMFKTGNMVIKRRHLPVVIGSAAGIVLLMLCCCLVVIIAYVYMNSMSSTKNDFPVKPTPKSFNDSGDEMVQQIFSQPSQDILESASKNNIDHQYTVTLYRLGDYFQEKLETNLFIVRLRGMYGEDTCCG